MQELSGEVARRVEFASCRAASFDEARGARALMMRRGSVMLAS
jgi:hypothetical protein